MTILEDVEKKAKVAKGISFILAMEYEGEVTIHPRSGQPCQGGETRKYYSTHGDLCTQPEDNKPGDLHHPFPKGRPVAIAFPKSTIAHSGKLPYFAKLRDFLTMSPESPFRSGFKDVHIHADGVGFTIGDTHVDPTVMIQGVQLLRALNNLSAYGPEFIESLSEIDALLLSIRNGFLGYYWDVTISPKKYYLGLPNDLSGGTYYDGYDYNRAFNKDLFVSSMDNPGGFNLQNNLYAGGTIRDKAMKFLDDVHKFMETEPDPIIEPYTFRTVSGKTYESHLEYIEKVKKGK